ncbi:MAG: response regulator [Planctomycetes bacterium]|nr:response regulator [Planctomycetota bacterium]MBM4078053.1 response regulator [Planctomycetota bacterium]
MRTILIVDDDAKQRRLYGEELACEGFTVWSALDGWEAIMMLQEQQFDLVVVNVRLQGSHGLHALLWMLEERRDLRVILHPGCLEVKGSYLRWKPDTYVVKSSDLSEIKCAIAEALAGRVGQGKPVPEPAPKPSLQSVERR